MSTPFQPALCTVGIFAVIGRYNRYRDVEILVNVRTDQERQRQLAGLPDDWPGKIVDLPGGTLQIGDLSFEQCLEREVAEETGGCKSKQFGGFFGPFPLIKEETGTAEKPHDLAFAAAVTLLGEPHPTPEASEHQWVTWRQLQFEEGVRLPGKLSSAGRMGKMIDKIINSHPMHVMLRSQEGMTGQSGVQLPTSSPVDPLGFAKAAAAQWVSADNRGEGRHVIYDVWYAVKVLGVSFADLALPDEETKRITRAVEDGHYYFSEAHTALEVERNPGKKVHPRRKK